jgi:uncharacterized membrane protein
MEAEQTQINLLVARAFEALDVPYYLGGSMASSVHGIYRATAAACPTGNGTTCSASSKSRGRAWIVVTWPSGRVNWA